jgi:transaldolase
MSGMNDLEALKQWTTVVADTGELSEIKRWRPQDATTNPSLVLKTVRSVENANLVKTVLSRYSNAPMDELIDRLLVKIGCQILAIIPGRVSTEVDARLSFDAKATVQRARRIIQMYSAEGVQSERVLIKVAATWEGVQAATQLAGEGIRTNLTLLFNFVQALACAKAGVQLISPFVGRIYDWHKKAAGASWDERANYAEKDPGVQSVKVIYEFFKTHQIKTEVMGASFRNTGQIRALAGCDLLTISPELLGELSASSTGLVRALDPGHIKAYSVANSEQDRDQSGASEIDPAYLQTPRALMQSLSESTFRLALNSDEMACEKLAQGVRTFCNDSQELERILATL